jgi:hypothetical protein
MAILVFGGGARLRVDAPPQQVVAAFRDALSGTGDETARM